MKILIVTDAWTPQINGVVRTLQMTVRELLALGGNREATRLAGIKTDRTETLVYVLSGTLAGLAAVLSVAHQSTPSIPV